MVVSSSCYEYIRQCKMVELYCASSRTQPHIHLQPHEHDMEVEVFSPIVLELDKSLGNMYTHIMHMYLVNSCHFESEIRPTC